MARSRSQKHVDRRRLDGDVSCSITARDRCGSAKPCDQHLGSPQGSPLRGGNRRVGSRAPWMRVRSLLRLASSPPSRQPSDLAMGCPMLGDRAAAVSHRSRLRPGAGREPIARPPPPTAADGPGGDARPGRFPRPDSIRVGVRQRGRGVGSGHRVSRISRARTPIPSCSGGEAFTVSLSSRCARISSFRSFRPGVSEGRGRRRCGDELVRFTA